jgi:alpha-L-rhamnosidase
VVIKGGYELIKNAMVSNMLSVQSDCPHREKLPYGGDLVADSPAALAFFDMSSFYKKVRHL